MAKWRCRLASTVRYTVIQGREESEIDTSLDIRERVTDVFQFINLIDGKAKVFRGDLLTTFNQTIFNPLKAATTVSQHVKLLRRPGDFEEFLLIKWNAIVFLLFV